VIDVIQKLLFSTFFSVLEQMAGLLFLAYFINFAQYEIYRSVKDNVEG
jgi:hypothetical protein